MVRNVNFRLLGLVGLLCPGAFGDMTCGDVKTFYKESSCCGQPAHAVDMGSLCGGGSALCGDVKTFYKESSCCGQPAHVVDMGTLCGSTRAPGAVKTIWLAGMAAEETALLESETLGEQAEAAMQQIVDALAISDATIDHVTRFSVYIKAIDAEKADDVAKAVDKFTKHIPDEKKAASTYIGVTSFAHPMVLVEIEATAVVPADPGALQGVTKECMNPRPQFGDCQIVTTTGSGPTTTLWISGHTGHESGDDTVEGQVAVAMKGMEEHLAQAGAALADLARVVFYVVNLDDAKTVSVAEAFLQAMPSIPEAERPATTILGVPGLANSSWMVEVEAYAVVPAREVPLTGVAKEFIDPGPVYSWAVSTSTLSGPSSTTLWISGMNAIGTPAENSESVQEQSEAALGKLEAALQKYGGSFDNVTFFQVYIVNIQEDNFNKMMGFAMTISKFAEHLPIDQRAAMTIVGVTGLARPNLLFEIQATAVLPALTP